MLIYSPKKRTKISLNITKKKHLTFNCFYPFVTVHNNAILILFSPTKNQISIEQRKTLLDCSN